MYTVNRAAAYVHRNTPIKLQYHNKMSDFVHRRVLSVSYTGVSSRRGVWCL